ncbi:MAG: DsbA family oxidoreductase [Sandaracinaceae bacterium]|nr:DsbA family oxidoreductase [Sandaracinaceae bacterium]
MSHPTPSVTLDIVSDVVCPWCVIGYKTLERALGSLGLTESAAVRFRPFELNPHMPAGGQHLGEHIAQKYGSSSEQSRTARARLTSLGESLGFAFRFSEDSRIYNTWKAHQLLHWAHETAGARAQIELQLALFSAYFTAGEPIDQVEVLARVAEQAGLPAQEAADVLYDERYAGLVRAEAEAFRDKGIHAVPSVVINGRSLLTGAQSEDVFVRALTRALEPAAEARP